VAASLLFLISIMVGHASAASPPDNPPDCPTGANLEELHTFCHYSGQQLQTLIAGNETGVHYNVRPMCVETQIVKESCVNQQKCAVPPDTFKYMVFRSKDGGPDEPWGTVCLGADEADQLGALTPARVFKEMKKLDWPTAELVIQPPDGRTLVNLKTNFLTTTTEPTSKTITLLGRQVEIEASPVDYTWHFGDGAIQAGADPGATYPDLRITHVYVEAGVTLSPSVDVTYGGRFRVNGEEWTPIPETLTVPGAPVTLAVLSATPHLVG
jgi:hypothetical protein